MNPIHLSADSFIKALQGEIVHDEQTGKLIIFCLSGMRNINI